MTVGMKLALFRIRFRWIKYPINPIWRKQRIEYEKKYFKNLHVSKFRKALSAELSLDIQPCYEPLNNCKLYRPLTKKRYNINPEYFKKINPLRFSLPVCENTFKNESITFHHSVLLAEKEDMNDILNAIVKIKENVDELL